MQHERLHAYFALSDAGDVLSYKDGKPLDMAALRILKELGASDYRVDLDTLVPDDDDGDGAGDTQAAAVTACCRDLRAIALCANTLAFD